MTISGHFLSGFLRAGFVELWPVTFWGQPAILGLHLAPLSGGMAVVVVVVVVVARDTDDLVANFEYSSECDVVAPSPPRLSLPL